MTYDLTVKSIVAIDREIVWVEAFNKPVVVIIQKSEYS